jgi:hypothetical protein
MLFNHGLSDTFIGLLRIEAEKDGWWRDVLNDPKLLIGVREEYLNVYWQGQALFTVRPNGGTLQVTTHEKFLLNPDLTDQVGLVDGKFDLTNLLAYGFMSEFRAGETLPRMKRAAEQFAGREKKGCHTIAERNATVVDFEIALPKDAAFADSKLNKVDLACFEECTGGVRLAFWEAKHFANRELRAQQGNPPVVDQINRYAAWIKAHSKEIKDSYRRVAQNLSNIKAMGWKRELHPSIQAVADGTPLSLDGVPPVGLLVFGFDQDQRDGAIWGVHRARLNEQINKIIARGDVANFNLPTHCSACS